MILPKESFYVLLIRNHEIMQSCKIRNHNIFYSKFDSHLKVPAPGKQSVEYIFTKPAWTINLYKFPIRSTSAMNPYGHSVIRYSTENNNRGNIIMNICGLKNCSLVNFFDPAEYLFTSKMEEGNEQGGVFRRSFLGVRIDNIDPKMTQKLDEFYKELSQKHTQGEIEFTMISHIFTNPLRNIFNLPERGNCAYFTGLGLKHIGLIKETSSWPLLLWFKLFVTQLKNNSQNINIISYRSINYKNEPKRSLMYPFYWIRNSYQHIWHLDKFANYKIKFDPVPGHKYDFEPIIKEDITAKTFWVDIYKNMKKLFRL
jgi:hypothetical protein